MILKPLDWVVLRELLRWQGNQPGGAFRFPVRDLARRTESHPNTIRARLGAMRKSGVLEGALFEPWPRLLGLARVGWMFHGVRPGGAERTRTTLADYPSASGAAIGLDWMFVHFWERSDSAAREQAESFAGRVGAKSHEQHFTSTDFPPSPADELRLSAMDWRLILALRKNTGGSLASAARALRTTSRTVERRALRLHKAGAGGMFPLLRPSRIEGMQIFHFRLLRGDQRAAPSLAAAFPERIAGPFGNGINAGVMVPMPNPAEAERRRTHAEGLPGIQELEVLLYADLAFSPAFEPYLEAAVARSQAAVAPT